MASRLEECGWKPQDAKSIVRSWLSWTQQWLVGQWAGLAVVLITDPQWTWRHEHDWACHNKYINHIIGNELYKRWNIALTYPWPLIAMQSHVIAQSVFIFFFWGCCKGHLRSCNAHGLIKTSKANQVDVNWIRYKESSPEYTCTMCFVLWMNCRQVNLNSLKRETIINQRSIGTK